ncbi:MULTISPECIES: hypothetical protein [Aphanizomenon]|uniref:hypothetical protein n=1 Tax=Aphanizomenon TaxID=1175 RepID=UPI0005425CCB|nr:MULTISPECIES: hypothetical protein [Aphanizomenon]KHG39890.1 hypothetical protein OA07_20840 [Aphanizomenon flos-aquae 2012/KM1/D3]MTJ28477.1 hypothetical protein [Aphanizomenon sp. UHCC 0183]QSV71277.1 MAG: hypothetical protein HEQ20_11540 [Aphanizomenon flos-aquae KM1D3_PB]
MSGQKTFNVTAGISTASQPSLFDGVASALQAYQERQRQERETAIKREHQETHNHWFWGYSRYLYPPFTRRMCIFTGKF